MTPILDGLRLSSYQLQQEIPKKAGIEKSNMRWTKTKMLIENLLCEKLKKRLSVYATSYNTSLGEQRRIWITIDGKEVFNASSAQFLMEHNKLWEEIRSKTKKSFPVR